MRKKSHILLARYLADQIPDDQSLQSHRKAFCFGSILPDIKPSFITKRHEFFGTFDEIQGKMQNLIDIGIEDSNQRVYWRRLGEVIHYMADYFTFPHNRIYTGSLSNHNYYEKILKRELKSCILNGEAQKYLEPAIYFSSFSALIEYIKTIHENYLNESRNVDNDMKFILNMCYQVIQGVIQLCSGERFTTVVQQGC